MDLEKTLEKAFVTEEEILLKSYGMVTKSVRLSAALAAWIDIVQERTKMTITDIIEYSLMLAASPEMDFKLADLARLHKAKKYKNGKKWTTRKIRALIREDMAAAEAFGVSNRDAWEQWKRHLKAYETKSKGGRPSTVRKP